MKKFNKILKSLVCVTTLAFSLVITNAQNNLEKKTPETFKEKILKKKDFRKISSNGKKSMSRGNHAVPSEIINLVWESMDWDIISKDIITYNAGTVLASEIIVKEYTGNHTFINYSSRNIRNYDQFNNQILDLSELWNSMNNTWEPSWKTINEFDTKNNIIFEANMFWDNSINQWDTLWGWKTTYTYNINGNILTVVSEDFNNATGNWETMKKEMRNYNSDGFWISSIYQFHNGTTWENEYKDEYSVNMSGEWTEAFFYSWDGSTWVSEDFKITDITWHNFADFEFSGYIFQSFNGVFYVNEEKYTGTYHSNGGYLLDLYEIWNGTGWENSFRMYNVYDSKDNITESIEQEWILGNWIMGNYGYKATYSYDSFDKMLSYEEEYYNSDTETWEKTNRYIYLYNTSVFSAGLDVSICYKDSTQLYGSGGTTYNWSPTSGLSCSNCASPKASPPIPTEYVVTVTNGTESGTDTVMVTVNPLPVAVVGNDEEICSGSNINLSASGGINYTWAPSEGLNNPNISNPLASPDTTTTYSVTVTDENNCSDQENLIVTVNALPVVSFSGLESHYCTTNPIVTLIGTPLGGTFIGSGITNDQFNPSIAGDGTHTITYAFTDNNNCSNYSEQEVSVNTCAGIKATSLITDLFMYPNPSKGIFMLELLQRQPGDLAIQISNTLGQSVFYRSFNQHNGSLKEEVNLAGFQAGIYLINIRSGENQINRIIIIE